MSQLTPKRDVTAGKIFSHIRGAWYVEYPEELVRQEFVCQLINDYGYTIEQMGEELSTQRGREQAEADIVIWRSAQDKKGRQSPAHCRRDQIE